MGLRGRHLFHNCCFGSPIESQEKRQTPLTGQTDNCPYCGQGNGLRSGSRRYVQKEHIIARPDKSQTIGVEDPGMASSPIKSHLTRRSAKSRDHLDVTQPGAATTLPADIKVTDELNFDKTDKTPMFKIKKYRVHMCVGITSDIPRPMFSDFHSFAASSVVCTCFHLLE